MEPQTSNGTKIAVGTLLALLLLSTLAGYWFFKRADSLGRGESPAAAEQFNPSIASHESQYLQTPDDRTVTMRDLSGKPLRAAGSVVQSQPIHPRGRLGSLCGSPQTKCLRIQGIETGPILAPGGTKLYYSWAYEQRDTPAGSSVPQSGFVSAADLTTNPVQSPPNTDGAPSAGRSAPDAPGSQTYIVAPARIDVTQGYRGVGDRSSKVFTYAPYGLPFTGAEYALLTWNWPGVEGGGIGRATVAAGARFVASNVEPIVQDTYAVDYDGNASSGTVNGSIVARYGRVESVRGPIYGWMTFSHTEADGTCVAHLRPVEGSAAAAPCA